MLHRALGTLLVLLAVAVLAAGCGDDSTSEGGDAASTDPGALDHVDGIVVTGPGDGFVLTPIDGGEDITFELGPAVQLGEVRAIEASGAPARVSYRPGEDPAVAASVLPAPTLGDDLETYEGTVVSVDADELVVDGEDGERTFDVSAADEGAFDVTHLQDHADEGEPIKVYFDPKSPDVGIAYEDA